MILTQEQAMAVAALKGGPLPIKDPNTDRNYVVIPAELFDRLRQFANDDFLPADAYGAIDEAFAANWDDPKMADYDRYEELKK